MGERGLDPVLPLGGTRGILAFCYMGDRGLDPVLPLRGDARNSAFLLHGRARFGPRSTPRGGRAELCLFVTWASEVWTPYYPYGGTRRILPFCYMAERGLDPVLPLRGDAPNSAFLLHGRARFGPRTTPTGGRAEFCLFVTWPSEVWTPYYPYGGTRRILPFCYMGERGLDPVLPRISKRTKNEKNSKSEKK